MTLLYSNNCLLNRNLQKAMYNITYNNNKLNNLCAINIYIKIETDHFHLFTFTP